MLKMLTILCLTVTQAKYLHKGGSKQTLNLANTNYLTSNIYFIMCQKLQFSVIKSYKPVAVMFISHTAMLIPDFSS